MIDGEIYVRIDGEKAIFAYRSNSENCSSLTHYACATEHNVYIKGRNGSCGRISKGETRPANEYEIEFFVNKLNIHGFYYNKPNRRVINIVTGELII